MKLGRLALYLMALACAIPAFFFGSSYLMHERGLMTVPFSPYVALAGWVGVALYIYWTTVFEAFNGREVLKLVAYCVVVGALIFLGISASYWAVTSAYGE